LNQLVAFREIQQGSHVIENDLDAIIFNACQSVWECEGLSLVSMQTTPVM
jgi:hypothetical protein